MAFLASPANKNPYRSSDMASSVYRGGNTSRLCHDNIFDVTSSTFAAPTNDANLSGHPIPHGYPPQHAYPLQHAYALQHAYPLQNVYALQHVYPNDEHCPTSDRATSIVHSTEGNQLAAPNKKRKYIESGSNKSMEEINTLTNKPTSEPNMLDEPTGVKRFPYKNFTIGIPDDLSTNSNTLVTYQQSSIDADAVYGVTTLTQVSFCGVFEGRSLILFNHPPIRRELLDPTLFVLALVEKYDLVVAGIALVGYPTSYKIPVSTQVIKLPKAADLKEIAKSLAMRASRSLKSSSTDQAPLRSFPTPLNWGGVVVTVCPQFPLPSKIQLPLEPMTLWSLVEWLTSRINRKNSESITEECALMQNISEWAARIHSHLDPGDYQRQVFLISSIGKQVKLRSGAWMWLGGMCEGEFVVLERKGKGNNAVVQMEEIVAVHEGL